MFYQNGEPVKLHDKVKLWDNCYGVVVCSLDTGEFSEAYPKDDWEYLRTGIVQNGFNMTTAAQFGGGDALWTTRSFTDASYFAQANPTGNWDNAAVVQVIISNSVLTNLQGSGLLTIQGPVYIFQPGGVNTLNQNGTFSKVLLK